ncbi:MAG: hypothetical protein LBE84_07270, partial [Planctomycetota bacterium]|nr:hypothetical protein [Planctomycetota bacterium]
MDCQSGHGHARRLLIVQRSRSPVKKIVLQGFLAIYFPKQQDFAKIGYFRTIIPIPKWFTVKPSIGEAIAANTCPGFTGNHS